MAKKITMKKAEKLNTKDKKIVTRVVAISCAVVIGVGIASPFLINGKVFIHKHKEMDIYLADGDTKVIFKDNCVLYDEVIFDKSLRSLKFTTGEVVMENIIKHSDGRIVGDIVLNGHDHDNDGYPDHAEDYHDDNHDHDGDGIPDHEPSYDDDNHDHDGDGIPDHATDEHEEDHDHDGDGIQDH